MKQEIEKEKTLDRRARRTRRLLREGLIELLMEKKINNISVQELVERIDINRSTFYLHYMDIYDLLSKIEDEMMQEILSRVEKKCQPLELDDLLSTIFHYISDNADLCLVLLSENGDIAFIEKLKRLVENASMEKIKSEFKANHAQHVAVVVSYSVSGCIGVLQSWLENGQSETLDELAKIMSNLILGGSMQFMADNTKLLTR